MIFTENSRVKIPAILHICRLGYTYLSLKNAEWDKSTNIFIDIFRESIKSINKPQIIDDSDIKRLLEDVALLLDNEDLGKSFYNRLVSSSDIKLVDFNDFSKNTFHVVTELEYKNGEECFRPDITLLINGLPLAFIEVKKPNNQKGILDEKDRIEKRFKIKEFRKFINISQILVFSNNMEYDQESIEPIQGAFYSTTSLGNANFNCFREEEALDLTMILKPEDDALENNVLKDTGHSAIKYSPEYITNKKTNTPTNRIITSLFCKERLAMLLKYCIAYVEQTNGTEKHVMRYPQLFATKAIEKNIESGLKAGIIWHTQGSGKTALAYYNIHSLTDYFQRKGIIPKFYFIVDRIDLLIQSKMEFENRGLSVHTVNSKEALVKDFRLNQAIHNLSGRREITVVNIQKFKDDTSFLKEKDYDVNVQRVYFLDEAHRNYKENGAFLTNLYSSDRDAIKICLTGTPLITPGKKSTDIFGPYIHKYYYNSSIADGYTLRLIREGIETSYRIKLKKTLESIDIIKGDINKREVFSHERFVEPMLDYIVQDFLNSRVFFGDYSIGGMVVCDSTEQARKMFEIFVSKYNPGQHTLEPVKNQYLKVAESSEEYGKYTNNSQKALIASLILHDFGSKEERKREIQDFKDGKIDLVFVYNMLLTGFDAKRLKKIYMGRIIEKHNLLQALTRVNRPYGNFRNGYVVDFADIRKEFDETNKAYFEELRLEHGDDIKYYSNLFRSEGDIEKDILEIKTKLFPYNLDNAELFSQQIIQIKDKRTILEIKKALESAKELYNSIRLGGHYDLLKRLDFRKINELYNEASRYLDNINFKEDIKNSVNTTNLINMALENILFMFRKLPPEELIIADKLKDIFRRTKEALSYNFDPKDQEFISLYDEFKRLFDKKKLDEVSQDAMNHNIGALQQIFDKVHDLNRRNNLLKAKYENDAKYAKIHKRILEKGIITKNDSLIYETLLEIKRQADDKVLMNTRMLKNEGYFTELLMQLIINGFEKAKIVLDLESSKYINNCLTREYINEFQGVA